MYSEMGGGRIAEGEKNAEKYLKIRQEKIVKKWSEKAPKVVQKLEYKKSYLM